MKTGCFTYGGEPTTDDRDTPTAGVADGTPGTIIGCVRKRR
jgi:hypothetical protein